MTGAGTGKDKGLGTTNQARMSAEAEAFAVCNLGRNTEEGSCVDRNIFSTPRTPLLQFLPIQFLPLALRMFLASSFLPKMVMREEISFLSK